MNDIPEINIHKSSQQDQDMCCGRMSAKNVIRDKAKRLRVRAEALDILADTLPEKLTPYQDEAIWKLAVDM